MKASSYKRVLAYLIDTMIIVLISTIFTLVIPKSDNYEKASIELTDVMEKYTNSEITEDEYLNEVNEISYTLNKESIAESIVSLVITTIYFVVLAYYSNGKTPGKKLMKLQIVTVDSDKKLTMNKLLLRSLIVDSILMNTITIVILLTLSKANYLTIYSVLSNIFSFIYIAVFVMILFRQDGRGLHDLISGTKVISLENLESSINKIDIVGEVIEEADVKSVEDNKIKNKQNNTNKNNRTKKNSK